LEEAFAEEFDSSLPDKLNDTHQIMIVSAQLDSETERIINYLSNNFDVPISSDILKKENNSLLQEVGCWILI
jgi:hypothetical protein